jgi:hypothetical protein
MLFLCGSLALRRLCRDKTVILRGFIPPVKGRAEKLLAVIAPLAALGLTLLALSACAAGSRRNAPLDLQREHGA